MLLVRKFVSWIVQIFKIFKWCLIEKLFAYSGIFTTLQLAFFFSFEIVQIPKIMFDFLVFKIHFLKKLWIEKPPNSKLQILKSYKTLQLITFLFKLTQSLKCLFENLIKIKYDKQTLLINIAVYIVNWYFARPYA